MIEEDVCVVVEVGVFVVVLEGMVEFLVVKIIK